MWCLTSALVLHSDDEHDDSLKTTANDSLVLKVPVCNQKCSQHAENCRELCSTAQDVGISGSKQEKILHLTGM